MEVYKMFSVPLDKELIKKKDEKKKPNMISQSEAPAPEEIVVHKHQRDTASLSSLPIHFHVLIFNIIIK